MNRGAGKTAFSWALVILATGVFSYLHIFGPWAFMVVLFFVSWTSFACPYGVPLNGSSEISAVSCRINNWGYLMAFAPLIYLPSFWTLSIIALRSVVLQWEYLFALIPSVFSSL